MLLKDSLYFIVMEPLETIRTVVGAAFFLQTLLLKLYVCNYLRKPGMGGKCLHAISLLFYGYFNSENKRVWFFYFLFLQSIGLLDK